MTIGRLDINTEGLLLLTNDGGLSRVLELPATGWLRRYRVRVHGKVDEKALAELKDGIAVDGVFYGGIEASLDREQGTNAWLTIGLREGKNREVKNILGALGLDVNRLIRISYGPFQLGELAEGEVQETQGQAAARPARRAADRGGRRQFRCADRQALLQQAGRREPRPREAGRAAQAAQRARAPVRIGEGGLIKAASAARARRGARQARRTRPERPALSVARAKRGERMRAAKGFGRFGPAGKPRGGEREREKRAHRSRRAAQGQCLDGARRAPDRGARAGQAAKARSPRRQARPEGAPASASAARAAPPAKPR